jgi:hypothetical protein
MNTSTQRIVYESIYSCLLKSNCQTFILSLILYSTILYIPLYCILKFAGPNAGVFESLHKEKHINSTRKKVQSATQRKIHRKPAQLYSTKLCEIYFDHLAKSRHFETGLNMSPLVVGIVRVRTSLYMG